MSDELRRLAEAATPGPWFVAKRPCDAGLAMIEDGRMSGLFPIVCEFAEANFIAAANPQAVIELLDRNTDLERRNGELLQFQDKTLRGQCVCSSDGTEREHYPGCRLRDVARIAELERRNGELETLALHVSRCRECAETSVMHCDNGRSLWELAMTRTKEQK